MDNQRTPAEVHRVPDEEEEVGLKVEILHRVIDVIKPEVEVAAKVHHHHHRHLQMAKIMTKLEENWKP